MLITSAALNPQIKDQEDRAISLRVLIEVGKTKKDITDRDMHKFWDEFRQELAMFNANFTELICTSPDQLRTSHQKMDHLCKEVETAWVLKQEQLAELKRILYHESYNNTGLASGSVGEICQGLDEYLNKANKTAFEEKIELDQHLEEVTQCLVRIETHPCPCEWGEWGQWSECSKTCESGSSTRERAVDKPALNNGTDCEGEASESGICNEVCCPIDCVWAQWEEWDSCPSGCGKQKTRLRHKDVEASCGGMQCQGEDFNKIHCSREHELEDQLVEVEAEKEGLVTEIERFREANEGLKELNDLLRMKSDQCKEETAHHVVAYKLIGEGGCKTEEVPPTGTEVQRNNLFSCATFCYSETGCQNFEYSPTTKRCFIHSDAISGSYASAGVKCYRMI